MSDTIRIASHRDTMASYMSADTQQSYLPRLRPQMTHSRTESSVTTASEAWDRELACVPAPLTLTPKVAQSDQFTTPQEEPPKQREHYLHKTKRFSRLRDIVSVQQQYDDANDNDNDDDDSEEFNADDYLDVESDYGDAMEIDFVANRRNHDTYSLLGSSTPTIIEESPTRYDNGRNVGLPSPRLPPMPSESFTKTDSIPLREMSPSPPAPRRETHMQRVWNAAQRGREMAFDQDVLTQTNVRSTVRERKKALWVLEGGQYTDNVSEADWELLARYIEGDSTKPAVTRPTSLVEPVPLPIPVNVPERQLTFQEVQILHNANVIFKSRGLDQSFMEYVASTGIGGNEHLTPEQAVERFIGDVHAYRNSMNPDAFTSFSSVTPATTESNRPAVPSGGHTSVTFAVPETPKTYNTTRGSTTSASGEHGGDALIKRKISVRAGLSSLFTANSRRPSSADKQRSSDEVKKRRSGEDENGRINDEKKRGSAVTSRDSKGSNGSGERVKRDWIEILGGLV